jgi:hypothetical protein
LASFDLDGECGFGFILSIRFKTSSRFAALDSFFSVKEFLRATWG